MKINKYKKGKLIKTPMQVVRAYESGQWLYLRDRVTDPSWIYNMQLGTVMYFLRRGMIRVAKPTVNVAAGVL